MEYAGIDTGPQPPQKIELPPLPFTYHRVDDPEKATYRERRYSGIRIGNEPHKPQTDEAILKHVKEQREGKDWFLKDYWREKGLPVEQIEVDINGSPVTIYNFSSETPFTDEHLARFQEAITQYASASPQIAEKLRWILIDNVVQLSAYGDPENLPENGDHLPNWRGIRLRPRAMGFHPHRIAKASNFEGTITHELTHMLQDEYEREWKEHFQWRSCWNDEFKDEWERKPTPDGSDVKYYNKKTGWMSPAHQFPLQPETSVTTYAWIAWNEDVCESRVAYQYDPELLKEKSEIKHAIMANHDAKKPAVVNITRVPKDQIKLPEITPETVTYYINENKPA